MSRIIVGLDIGTCFIRTVIASVDHNGKIEVIGASKKPSQGLRNGVIVNIDATVKAMQETIEEAEQMAGTIVTHVYTAIGGSQVESLDSKGQIGIDPKGRNRPIQIDQNAKNRAFESAQAILIPLDRRLLHIIPQSYIVDGQEYPDPIGIQGVRLEVKTHLVTASTTALGNIKTSVERAGYEPSRITLKTLAAANATIHDDEMDLGSILIDLGGGTTDVMVLNKGAPVFTASIPTGGNKVTSDIATVLGVPVPIAEKLKLENGTCWLYGGEENEEIIIPPIGGLPPEQTNKEVLYEIISARMEEILTAVKKEVVRRANLKRLDGSIVLTGGGAMMPGILELTQSIWNTTAVRIGYSADFGGVNDFYREADFATATGLVITNKNDMSAENVSKKTAKKDSNSRFKNLLKKFT